MASSSSFSPSSPPSPSPSTHSRSPSIHHPQLTHATTPQFIIQQSLTPIKVGKNWACRICGRQFIRRFNCSTHERTHLDLRERAQFQCVLCERAFTRRHDLQRHIHSVHPGHTIQRIGSNRTLSIQVSSSSTSSTNPSNPIQVHPIPLHPQPIPRSNPISHPSNLTQPEVTLGASSNLQILHPPLSSSILIPTSASTSAPSISTSSQHPTLSRMLTLGSIRELSPVIERVPLDQIPLFNPDRDLIFKYDKRWACGTCGRVFVRRNNCKAHEATHRDIREHQCPICFRSFSRKHDLERHIGAVHPRNHATDGSDGYESNDPSLVRRKRQKHVEVCDWNTIDPFILSLDNPKQTEIKETDHIHQNSTQEKPTRRAHNDLPRGTQESKTPRQSTIRSGPPRSLRSSSPRSSSKAQKSRSRHQSHTGDRLDSIPTPHFDIFETFEPRLTSRTMDTPIKNPSSVEDHPIVPQPVRDDVGLIDEHQDHLSSSPSFSDKLDLPFDPRLFG